MKPILSLILLFQTVFVFGQTTDSTRVDSLQKDNYEWRSLETDIYSIEYPMKWIADNSKQLGAELFLFSPEESKEDQFIESVNLVITDLSPQNTSFEKFIQQSKNELASMITNFKLLESKQIENQNGKCQLMVYTGDHNQYKLKFKKLYWIINNKVFILTFTGEQDKYGSYSEAINKISNSFLIKK